MRSFLFFLFTPLLLMSLFLPTCDDDDDSGSSSGPAQDDDDSSPSDNDDDGSPEDDDVDTSPNGDDDDDDSSADDDDDNNDDDDNDNDNNNDDQSPPPLDPPAYGWILMDTERTHVSWVLNQTAAYGIDHVQLSHNLIMEIDEIERDETKAALLQDIAQEAHGLGLEVWVWSHEFTDEEKYSTICFDPEDPIWEERKDAYRYALTRIPEIDGVILMFGSADTEPWYALCTCDWCKENEPHDSALLALLYPPLVDRARMVYDAVGAVVLDEFGKKLRMRTFMHQPLEFYWLGESLRAGTDWRLSVMTKDVPQDWQPYYPHDPLIGDVGPRHQIIEMDLGNEYWGAGKILNGQVDYIFYRYSYDRQAGARGAAARIERGSDHAFGNPNEINIYAFTRLVQDETATPDQVYRDWFAQRYGIAAESPEATVMKTIFRDSHYAMRKMYYTLGQWTMRKGSDVPDQARFPEQLWSRCSAFYDVAWLNSFLALASPDEQTLRDLWQEHQEAAELAGDNLALLESIEAAFADPDDYAELHEMLAYHVDLTEVWRLMIDTTYRYVHYQRNHPEVADNLEWNARRLLEIADEFEVNWGADNPLAPVDNIRAFVADLREGFPDQTENEEYAPPRLSDIAAEDLENGNYRITWKSSEPTYSRVEWAADLPLYDGDSGETTELVTEHQVEIAVTFDGRGVYRVGGHTGDGTLIRSGDFWFGLDGE